MLSTIGSTAPNTSAAIAALQKQLAQYEKQLQADDSSGGKSTASSAEVVATQITEVETEIAQLTQAGSLTAISAGSALGNTINVTA
jgi:hypothetical protein